MSAELPIAIIGAGPVGLAAAAHVVERGLTPLILERGRTVGHAVRHWGHVHVFSPWSFNIDKAARRLLEQRTWIAPDPDALPTGNALIDDYLAPLAAHPEIAPHLRLGAEVVSVNRAGYDKVMSPGRDEAPFRLRWRDRDGRDHEALARAVIDASGTWFTPNPLGVDGLAVRGERAVADRIAYGIPDVAGTAAATYAGKRVLVVGSGHSAINVVLDLLALQESAPETKVTWGVRRDRIDRLLGGGLNDQLPARGALGLAAKKAIAEGRLAMLAPYAAEQIKTDGAGLKVTGRLGGQPHELTVDRIVVATGFRPDLSPFSELRLSVDPIMEAPPALAPLIDPNLHSCGTVPPHGVVELTHPEAGFYIVGSKSYGRAPTFLMATGYEQVRSVVAEIAGDREAARNVQLALPETGVCSATPRAAAAEDAAASGCCGGPPKVRQDACCAVDEAAKDAGKGGCGSQAA